MIIYKSTYKICERFCIFHLLGLAYNSINTLLLFFVISVIMTNQNFWVTW